MPQFEVIVSYLVNADSSGEAIRRAAKYGCDAAYIAEQEIAARLGHKPEVVTRDVEVRPVISGTPPAGS